MWKGHMPPHSIPSPQARVKQNSTDPSWRLHLTLTSATVPSGLIYNTLYTCELISGTVLRSLILRQMKDLPVHQCHLNQAQCRAQNTSPTSSVSMNHPAWAERLDSKGIPHVASNIQYVVQTYLYIESAGPCFKSEEEYWSSVEERIIQYSFHTSFKWYECTS